VTRAELTEGTVFRLGRRDAGDAFYSDGVVPDVDDFLLSTADNERVQQMKVGSLSVWDAALTTPAEANAFLPPRSRAVLWLDIADIRGLPYGLHVYREPLPEQRPGAAGHCVIENVWSEDKRSRKQTRVDLVDLAMRRPLARTDAD
jgi:hypothetical protein